MRITDKSLHKEIREFNNRQKLNIAPEMFFLWEYKLNTNILNTNHAEYIEYPRNSLFNILKAYNVYFKLANNEIKKFQILILMNSFLCYLYIKNIILN